MAIYMKAGKIQGSVKAKGHEGWIIVSGCSFDIDVDLEVLPKEDAERKVKIKLGAMTVDKSAGASSPGLLEWKLKKTKYPEVMLDVCKEDGQHYLRHTLKGVKLPDYSMRVDFDGDSSVTLKLDFDEIRMEQISFDKQNKPLGNPHHATCKREETG